MGWPFQSYLKEGDPLHKVKADDLMTMMRIFNDIKGEGCYIEKTTSGWGWKINVTGTVGSGGGDYHFKLGKTAGDTAATIRYGTWHRTSSDTGDMVRASLNCAENSTVTIGTAIAASSTYYVYVRPCNDSSGTFETDVLVSGQDAAMDTTSDTTSGKRYIGKYTTDSDGNVADITQWHMGDIYDKWLDVNEECLSYNSGMGSSPLQLRDFNDDTTTAPQDSTDAHWLYKSTYGGGNNQLRYATDSQLAAMVSGWLPASPTDTQAVIDIIDTTVSADYVDTLMHSHAAHTSLDTDDHPQYLLLEGDTGRNLMGGTIADSAGARSIAPSARELTDSTEAATICWGTRQISGGVWTVTDTTSAGLGTGALVVNGGIYADMGIYANGMSRADSVAIASADGHIAILNDTYSYLVGSFVGATVADQLAGGINYGATHEVRVDQLLPGDMVLVRRT